MLKKTSINRNPVFLLFALGVIVYSPFAFSYVGPGIGAGALVAVLGTLFGLVMLLVGIVWYPIKKMIRYLRSKK